MIQLAKVEGGAMIVREGVVLYTGTMSDCILELAAGYESIGRAPTLANVINDGFVIERMM